MEKLINKILTEWAYRTHDGMPNINNPLHLINLKDALEELSLPRKVTEKLLRNLRELDFKNKADFAAYKKDHKMRPDTKVNIGGKETTAGDAEADLDAKDTETDSDRPKPSVPLNERPRVEMSKEERTKMKELESREDELSDSEQKELRDLRDKRDDEKVDTALHMSSAEHKKLSKEYEDIEKRIKAKTATKEDLKRKEQLEEKGIGAGTATSQAGEAITHFTLRMLKEGYTEKEIQDYLEKLVSNPDHVLGGSSKLREWVPRGMAAAKKVIKEVGGIDNIKTISWDTDEGRKAMGVRTTKEGFKTASDMFIETNDGKRIGVSLKKDGQVRILSGGWAKQYKKLRDGMLARDKDGELTKKKFRKKDGTLTTDENDPDIERNKDGSPVVTTSIEEFDRQAGAHTHKAEVDAAARAGATDILDNLEKEGMGGADGKELDKIIKNEDGYGDDIIGSSSERKKTVEPYVIIDNPNFDPKKKETRNNPRQIKKMGHKKDEKGNIVPVEGREAREQGAKQLLNRIKSGPKTKENPDGYSADDLVVFAKIIQQSDIRNRHEKHHDDMRAADNNLTERAMTAIQKDPALQGAVKDYILDALHIDKALGFNVGDDLDEFMTVFGIGDDGVSMNIETLTNLFGEKFESIMGQTKQEAEQLNKDYKDGKISKEEAEQRMGKLKERVYAVIREDLTVDYESNAIKFKQEFPNPDFDESKPESEKNPRFKISEYSLYDWKARAKGLARAVAMELQNNDFMIFALENGTPDINQWPEKEQARWFNKVNNKLNKEEKERIEAGEKPPFEDIENEREINFKNWNKVDPKTAEKKKAETEK